VKDDPHPLDEQYLDQLYALDEALEQGKDLATGPDSALDDRLRRGLDCLKLLDKVRRRGQDTSIPGDGNSTLPVTPVDRIPGRIGKFELKQELGRGGFGVVFLARDRGLDCEVALKVPHGHVLTDVRLRERFRREARVAASLQHPNIVSVREAGEVGPVCYIVYDYCPGITLGDWLRQQRDPVPFTLAASWVAALAEAVAHAHTKGVMHRDLKPGNILLHDAQFRGSTIALTSALTGRFTPRITDFGLAKLEREEGHTVSGAILGTPSYMAPEQASGKSEISPAVDVYALGVILYELLTGRVPFRGETDMETLLMVRLHEPMPPRKLRPKLPRDLETICLKCLQKDARQRYPSAADLAEDLKRYLEGCPIQARPVSAAERAWRICRRHLVVTALAASLLVALAGGIAGVWWQSHHRQLQADATQAWLLKYQDLLWTEISHARKLLDDPATEKEGRDKLLTILQYLDTLLRDTQLAPVLRREAARLSTQAGDIHMMLGQYPKSQARFKQAIQMYEGLHTERTDVGLDHAKVIVLYARLCRAMKLPQQAESLYREAIRLGDDYIASNPQSTEGLSFLTMTYVSFSGMLRGPERREDALHCHQRAIECSELALQLRPNDSELLLNKASVLDEYGWKCFLDNQVEEATKLFHEVLSLRETVYRQQPQRDIVREYLARSHWRVAQTAIKRKQLQEAEDHYQVSKRMNDELAKDFPGRPQYADNSAFDRGWLCQLYESQKQFDKAVTSIREAVAMRERLAKNFPDLEANQYELTLLQFSLSNMLRKQNKNLEAESVYRAALALNDKLAREQPQDPKFLELHVTHLRTVATQAEKDKNQEQAEQAHQRLLEAREKLVQDYPSVARYKRDLDESYSRVGNAFKKAGRWKEAADAMRRAIALRDEVAQSQEGQPRDRQKQALRYLYLGLIFQEAGDLDQAWQQFLTAHELYAALDPKDRSLEYLVLDHGHALESIGAVLWEKRHPEAIKYFAMTLPLREQLLKSARTKQHYMLLARIHYNLSHVYWHGRYDGFSAARHSILSMYIDPSFTQPLVDPQLILRVIHAWVQPSAPATPTGRTQ
jgi:tetratricopeptide (TPR) repeat protein